MNTSLLQAIACSVVLLFFSSTSTANEMVKVPFKYAKGQNLFNQNCASCHSKTLTGSDKGPPLLHPFYKPSHHGDAAFYRAALKGVRAHHWNFGNMPPVPNMTEEKMKQIIKYVRFFQHEKKLY